MTKFGYLSRRYHPENDMPPGTRTVRRPGRSSRAPIIAQQPLIEEDEGPKRPTHVHGIEIEREEPISHMPGVEFRISKLHLADGTLAHACRDCDFTDHTRGQIMMHRNEKHGTRIGQKKRKSLEAEATELLDLVAPARPDGKVATSPMELTLGEIVAMAPSFAALGDLLDKTESERDAALEELKERRKHDRENAHKIDSFDEMRDELVDLRVRDRGRGNYEEVKAEMYALKAWKKKMITKLSGLGFQLNEEDQ